MKYLRGLTIVIACAQSGILLTGVNIPPIRKKIIMKKNPTNIACWTVEA